MKKLLAIALTLAMLLSCGVFAAADDALSEDIVILYTHDVHTYIDNPISYDVIAGVKQSF